MIPTYLWIKQMGLIDTIWVMVLPGVGAYSIFVYRAFFSQLPDSLKDAARIDGAGHFRVLFTIILPLSKPLLATMALFSIVGHWNSYLSAIMYLRDQDKFPVQMLLRSLIASADVLLEDPEMRNMMQSMNFSTRSLKAAAVVITMFPIMCVYPFMQKYFAKGVLIGSVKG